MTNKLISALQLEGAAILTSYTAGTAIPAGNADRIVVSGRALTIAGSASTSAELKLQGSLNGTDGWEDLGVLDLEVATPAVALNITKATGPDTTKGLACLFDATMPWVRVAGKWTGGVGLAGESLIASLILL